MAKEFEGDYEYEEAMRAGEMKRFPETPKIPEFAPISEAFSASVDRLIALYSLPVVFAYLAGECAEGSNGIPLKEIEQLQKSNDLSEFETYCSVMRYALDSKGSLKDDALLLMWPVGGRFIKFLQCSTMSLENDITSQGIQSLFFSLLGGAYGAFEALASDLWVEAVNRDAVLAKNVIEASKDKHLPLSTISGYDFDLRSSMGKIFKDNAKVSFQSLNSIREAYRVAFKSEACSIFDSNELLVVAEKVRHLAAHKGGRIDAQFEKEMKKLGISMPFQAGDFLSLHGSQVADLIDACLRTAVELFLFVDERVFSHATT